MKNLIKKITKVKVMLKIWPQLFSSLKNSNEFMVDKKRNNIIVKSSSGKKQLKQSRYTSYSFDEIFDDDENLVN